MASKKPRKTKTVYPAQKRKRNAPVNPTKQRAINQNKLVKLPSISDLYAASSTSKGAIPPPKVRRVRLHTNPKR